MSQCVGFNIPLDTQHVILEMSLSRQSIVLVLTTKNKETKHHIHSKPKRETEKLSTNKKAISCFGTPFTTSGQMEQALFLQHQSPHGARVYWDCLNIWNEKMTLIGSVSIVWQCMQMVQHRGNIWWHSVKEDMKSVGLPWNDAYICNESKLWLAADKMRCKPQLTIWTLLCNISVCIAGVCFHTQFCLTNVLLSIQTHKHWKTDLSAIYFCKQHKNYNRCSTHWQLNSNGQCISNGMYASSFSIRVCNTSHNQL